MVELRQVLDRAPPVLGVDVVGQLSGDAGRESLDQPLGKMSGTVNSCGALNRNGSRRKLRRELIERRQ